MVLYDSLPSPALSEYVRVYRIVHFSFGRHDALPFKPYPPRPEHCLSFYPRDTESVRYGDGRETVTNLRSALIGQHHVVTDRFVGREFLLIQVVFRPGALFRLTGIPAPELTDRYVDAESVFPRGIREVNERLSGMPDTQGMLGVIESFLEGLAGREKKGFHRLDAMGDLMLKAKENLSIEWLARESCLSLRQYERRFTERMGVPPRYFNRIVRFENAYRIRNTSPHLDWLSVALLAGYHDYQHLARDYREFTGKTPVAFHLLDLAAPERRFGEADTY